MVLLIYIFYYLSEMGGRFYSLTPRRLDGVRGLQLGGGNKA